MPTISRASRIFALLTALMLLALGGAGAQTSPAATTFSPGSVPVGSQALVLAVTGTGFTPDAHVLWNGAALATVYDSATQLTATVPAALLTQGGWFTVSVTEAGGTSNLLSFPVVNPAPTLTALSPASAPATGQTIRVALTGTNFVPGGQVTLGDGSTLYTSVGSPTQASVLVPDTLMATPGPLSLTFANFNPSAGPSAPLVFLRTSTPVITGLSPWQCVVGSGPLTLDILGSLFAPVSVALWNGTPLQVLGLESDAIRVTVPASLTAQVGTAQITVSSGAAGTSNAVSFTVGYPVPALSAISPGTAQAGGPDLTVSLMGTGFLPTTTAWTQEGGTSAYPYGAQLTATYVSPTQLTAVVPAILLAGGGTLHLQARNPAPGGGFSLALPLGVVSPSPTLTALSPASATAGGSAFTLTVNGIGFVGTPGAPTLYNLSRGSAILWNGSQVTTQFISPTQLSATIPAADIAAAGTAQVTVVSPAPGGGTTAALPFTIAADTSAPTTTASLGGTSGANGWYTSPAIVMLSATDPDGAADVAATHYTLDGGPAQTYTTPFTVLGDATHALTFWSVDRAGNVETTNSQAVKIDATAPTLTFGSPSPAPSAAGWNNVPVSVPYTAGDATSGVAFAGPGSPVQISGEGRGQTVPITVADNAGNRVTANSPAANIDRTAPVTTGAVAGVQVTLSATDALSGVAATFYALDKGAAQSYAAPFSVTGVGTHTVTFWSRDVAGNVEPSHVLSITVPPAGYVTVTPNVSGNTNLWWGQENVGISSAQTITALMVTIKVKQTGGLSFHDQFYTGPWGPLAQSRASSATTLTYTWAMKAGQSIPPGAWYCAAQWNGTGGAHPTSGDTYTVSATAGGRTQTFSGHF